MGDAQISGWYLLLFVAIWTMFGIAGGYVAVQSCGWPYWLGFLIGFVGGVLGLAVLWIVGRERKRKAARALTPRSATGAAAEPPGRRRTQACQQCGNLVDGQASTCEYCGSDLPASKG
jgi:hypothetical protein